MIVFECKCPRCHSVVKDKSNLNYGQLKGKQILFACKACHTYINSKFEDLNIKRIDNTSKQVVLV